VSFPEHIAGHAIKVRPRTGADLPLIREIYISHRWEETQTLHGWTDDQKIAFLDSQFQLQCRHYDTHYHDAEFYIVEVAGQPAGRLYLWDHNKTDLRIVEISFLAPFRGLGIGGGLLRHIQDRALAAGKSCSIHVEINNPARRLYNRLGFREAEVVGPYLRLNWSAD
jgi:ribosomal protein S18 acetylase RimI-like enzyme